MLELSQSLAGSLLDVQQLSKPTRLQSKLAVTFHPSRCRPIDFVPVIGEASRTYQPISRRSIRGSAAPSGSSSTSSGQGASDRL